MEAWTGIELERAGTGGRPSSGDRSHEGGWPPGPQPPQGPWRRQDQCGARRCRLQLPAAPSLVQPSLARLLAAGWAVAS